jgi:hypothetical protein
MLDLAVSGRGVVVDAALRTSTDRNVRAAMARFGPAVRAVRVLYAQLPADLPMCGIRVLLASGLGLIVRHHAETLELAFRAALRQASAEIALDVHEH